MQQSHTEATLYVRQWDGILYIERRLLERFVLDVQESGSSKLLVKLQSNGRCSWVCIIRTGLQTAVTGFTCNPVSCIYILAWASALLVSTSRAMPEPLNVGRVTRQHPRSFCILMQGKEEERRSKGVSRLPYLDMP